MSARRLPAPVAVLLVVAGSVAWAAAQWPVAPPPPAVCSSTVSAGTGSGAPLKP